MDTNTYIWIGVGVVVALMIIIGYFAEQTNFGKKGFKEKAEKQKPKQKKTNKKVDQEEPEVSPVEHELKPIPETLETPSLEPNVSLEPEQMPVQNDWNTPLDTDQEEDLDVPLQPAYKNEELDVPLTPFYDHEEKSEAPLQPYVVEEDLNAPLEPYTKQEAYEEPTDKYYNMEEDLNVPLQDNYNSTWEEPLVEEHETRVSRHAEPSYEEEIFQMDPEVKPENQPEPQDINTTDIDLPDISAIQNTEIPKEEDDDDIWKF